MELMAEPRAFCLPTKYSATELSAQLPSFVLVLSFFPPVLKTKPRVLSLLGKWLCLS